MHLGLTLSPLVNKPSAFQGQVVLKQGVLHPHPLELPPTFAWYSKPTFPPSTCDLPGAACLSQAGWDGQPRGTGPVVWSDFPTVAWAGHLAWGLVAEGACRW